MTTLPRAHRRHVPPDTPAPTFREDLAAYREGLLAQGFWALRVHRFGERRRGVRLRPLRAAWAVLYHAVALPTRIVTGVHIGTGARIGRRFVIEHSFVVVNARAVIGDDVIVRPGVVIGNRTLDRPHDVPVIGDRVNIGAGAKLLGAIQVGDDAAIGANAVVLRDVPAGHVAVGMPATVRPRSGTTRAANDAARTVRALATALALAIVGVMSGGSTAAAETEAPAFERGINLARPFNLPARDADGGYADPPFTHPDATVERWELDRLAAIGFDHVRLPVSPGVFMSAAPATRKRLDAELAAFVGETLYTGLDVLLDPHPTPGDRPFAPADILGSEDALLRYEAFLLDLAALALGHPPDRVALGLMNEPQAACEAEGTDWTVHQRRLHAAVRRAAPELVLVVTPGCWSGAKGLAHLRMDAFDERTLVDVHYYGPYAFTHQSPRWAAEPFRFVAGLSYPAEEGSALRTLAISRRWQQHLREDGYSGEIDAPGAARIITDYYVRRRPDAREVERVMADIAEWAEAEGVPSDRIVIGEFGAWTLQPPVADAEDGSRARWLRDVRVAAEAQGFGWAHWEYTSPFGIVGDDRALDPEVVEALGLDAVPRDRVTQ